MNTLEFKDRLNEMFAKHPMLAQSNPMSLNELMYVLRMESDVDYSISTTDGMCIPSVKSTFVPSSTLARKVMAIECEEEYKGVIFVELK